MGPEVDSLTETTLTAKCGNTKCESYTPAVSGNCVSSRGTNTYQEFTLAESAPGEKREYLKMDDMFYDDWDSQKSLSSSERVHTHTPDTESQNLTAKNERGSVLRDALKVINGERQNQYGSPEDSFELIARYWSVYLRAAGVMVDDVEMQLNRREVAEMMALFKIARMSGQKTTRDNYVDCAGYIGIAGDMI